MKNQPPLFITIVYLRKSNGNKSNIDIILQHQRVHSITGHEHITVPPKIGLECMALNSEVAVEKQRISSCTGSCKNSGTFLHQRQKTQEHHPVRGSTSGFRHIPQQQTLSTQQHSSTTELQYLRLPAIQQNLRS